MANTIQSNMTEPNWEEVLETIYREDIIWGKDEDYDESHPVVSEVSGEAEEVQDTLAYLHQCGLVGSVQAGLHADISRPGKEGLMPMSDSDKRTGAFLGLTPSGFKVAHEREMQKQDQQLNLSIVALTAILTITAAIQAVSSVLVLDGFERDIMIFTIIILFLIVIVFVLRQKKRLGS